MNSAELRQKYLDFFKSHGHAIIGSASLISENDPSVLFTTAGMHPLVPFLLGEKHPAGNRLADAQKCIRTSDIEEVGDRTHHTFFEMMGNWSLGDYFKEESLNYSWEFLTSPEWLGLDKNRFAVSVFAGDADAPFDSEAYSIWSKIFSDNNLPLERIAKLPKKNNWWEPGATGPCGPDSEIFYWVGNPQETPTSFNDDNDLWVEVWNNVFMQYNKTASGFETLSQKNVDTGLGLERVSAVINGLDDNYRTDLFWPLIEAIEVLSGKKYEAENIQPMRVIADHIKAATLIIGDDKGIAPSNNDQGYVVRRLIRRAYRFGRQLGIEGNSWMASLAAKVIDIYAPIYPELSKNKEFIFANFNQEGEKFAHTLEKGLLEFNKLADANLSGQAAFDLYQSYGFPLEMTEELAREKGLSVDREAFNVELKKHQDLSRTAAAGKFKGGLADSSRETTELHTAAHLLLASLRRVLGDHVFQKGSNITQERLRFDFSHPEKLSQEQLKGVEDLVNGAITASLAVVCEELPLDEAKKRGATGVFDSKYGDRVKVYTIYKPEENGKIDYSQAFSQEICGGPHVESLAGLGHFKISKEEASSAGVRRIKAILEKNS